MERTDHLVCLVCPGRWVLEGFRVREGSTGSPDLQEYRALKDLLVLRAMRDPPGPRDHPV